jgi:serine/threonine protein kinase
MDLVTGGELFEAVAAATRLSEATARMYFQQLVDGVTYCHSRSVYHRDLKPENLLLSGDKKTLKIADFGMASSKSTNYRSDLMHPLTGSPNYLAPELAFGPATCYDGAKVDVWACGIILYAMLAGSLPFQAATLQDLNKAIGHSSVVFPKHFSYDVIKLLRAMLQKDPGKRVTMEDVKSFTWFKVSYEPAIIPPQGSTVVSVASQGQSDPSQTPIPIDKIASKDRISRKLRRKLLGGSSKFSNSVTSSNSDTQKEPEDENERPNSASSGAKRRKSSSVKVTGKLEKSITERTNSAFATMSSSRSVTPLSLAIPYSLARGEQDDVTSISSEWQRVTDINSGQANQVTDEAITQSTSSGKSAPLHSTSSVFAQGNSKTLTNDDPETSRDRAATSFDVGGRSGSGELTRIRAHNTSTAESDNALKPGRSRRPHLRRQDGISSISSTSNMPVPLALAQEHQQAMRQISGYDQSIEGTLEMPVRMRTHRLLSANLFGRVTSKASDDRDPDSMKGNFRPRLPSFGTTRPGSRTQVISRTTSQTLSGDASGPGNDDVEAPKSLLLGPDFWALPASSPDRSTKLKTSSFLSSAPHLEAGFATEQALHSSKSNIRDAQNAELSNVLLEQNCKHETLHVATLDVKPKHSRKEGNARDIDISIVNGPASLNETSTLTSIIKSEACIDSPLTPPDSAVCTEFSAQMANSISQERPDISESSKPLAGTISIPLPRRQDENLHPVSIEFSTLKGGSLVQEEYLEDPATSSHDVGLPAYIHEELRRADHDNGYPPWCALDIDVFEDCDENTWDSPVFDPKRRLTEIAELLQKRPKALNAYNITHIDFSMPTALAEDLPITTNNTWREICLASGDPDLSTHCASSVPTRSTCE